MKQKQVLEVYYEGKIYRITAPWIWRILRRLFRTNRNHKDRLFLRLFNDPVILLQLYNAVNHSDYDNPDDLIITTLEDAVYLGMKNDCSFLIGDYLNLYEHQSTFNPNMPLRGFLYFSELLKNELDQQGANIYGHKLVKIPTPRYIVFYNGTEEYPDSMDLNLSEAFEHSEGCMEFTATMLNINLGHNSEIMKHCKTLEEYSQFIDRIRWYKNMGYPQADAIDAAVEYCIDHSILEAFLRKNRNEVKNLILYEYDEKKYKKALREEALEEGREEGREEGKSLILTLTTLMIQNGQTDEIPKLKGNPVFFEEMLKKYNLKD